MVLSKNTWLLVQDNISRRNLRGVLQLNTLCRPEEVFLLSRSTLAWRFYREQFMA
mgnify:CR=1 FL=1